VKLRFRRRGVRLYQADVLEALPRLARAGEAFDAVVTDPPYSSGGLYRGDRAAGSSVKYYKAALPNFTGDNRDQRSYLAWALLWLAGARKITRPGGLLCCFIDWRQLPTLSDAIQAAGWVWRGVLAWDRTESKARPRPGGFRNQVEFIAWATNGPVDRGGPVIRGAWREPTVWPRDRVHAAQKPLSVVRDLVRCVWRDGGQVLDPFAGGATTLVAAQELGVPAVGLELDDGACRAAIERLREKRPQLAAAAA